MAALALVDAAEVLRLPEEGAQRLPQSRADELTLEPGALLIDGDRIVGFEADETCRRVPCDGCALVPGFVDCHTHLPFAGWRADEYALRIAGAGQREWASPHLRVRRRREPSANRRLDVDRPANRRLGLLVPLAQQEL